MSAPNPDPNSMLMADRALADYLDGYIDAIQFECLIGRALEVEADGGRLHTHGRAPGITRLYAGPHAWPHG